MLVSILALGCSGSTPCTACPIEGRYQMAYQDFTSQSADCATLPPIEGPATIEITRNGAEVRATLAGIACRGTVQDSYDFSLSGSTSGDGGIGSTDGGLESQTVSLRGYFVPAMGSGDAGAAGTIKGRWITRTERGARVCEAEQPCTGTQLK